MKFLHLTLPSLLGVLFVYAAPNSNASPTVALTPTTTCFQPPTTTNSMKWSDNAYITKHMIIPPSSTPIFWMGRVPHSTQGVLPAAQACATAHHGVTIGMVMCQNGFLGPPPPSVDQSQEAETWNHLVSEVYAQHAKGVAWTIAGNFTATSDYLADEFPALVKNKEVTAVLGIHSDTCEPFCYWYCPRNSKDMDCDVGICFHGVILLLN